MVDKDTAAPANPLLTVALEIPSAQVLADEAGIIQDLQYVIECCKRVLLLLERPEAERDSIVALALWSSALVTYGRCFGKGKFGLTNEDVASLPLEGEVVKYHKWLLEERSKHTQHSGNPFETSRVGAALSPRDQFKRRVEGISILAISHVLVDDAGVRQLGGLATELAKQTAERAQKQQGVVEADVRKLRVEDLYELPPLQVGADEDDAPGDTAVGDTASGDTAVGDTAG